MTSGVTDRSGLLASSASVKESAESLSEQLRRNPSALDDFTERIEDQFRRGEISQEEVERLKQMALHAVEAALDRGDQIETLEPRTEDLSSHAQTFTKTSGELQARLRRRN